MARKLLVSLMKEDRDWTIGWRWESTNAEKCSVIEGWEETRGKPDYWVYKIWGGGRQ